MALAESSSMVLDGYFSMDLKTSPCACGLCATSVDASFGGLKNQQLDNILERCVVVKN